MSADKYLQAAAAQLESAATAVKGELDQMRSDYMNYERQANNEIDSMKAQLRAIDGQTLMANQQGDAVAGLQTGAQNLRRSISAKEQELKTRKAQTEGAIKAKEGAINGLMNQSRGLYGQAANFK